MNTGTDVPCAAALGAHGTQIIDAHMHFSRIESFADTARLYAGVDYSAEGLLKECRENGVTHVVGMGVEETRKFNFPDDAAPALMGCDLPRPPQILAVCAGINPYRLDAQALINLEEKFKRHAIAGVKIYPGYYPFTASHPVYHPVYALAEQYNKPVTVHTGDTFSERGLLKYARPLHADEAAVRFRGVNFILAHMGDPWILDACELAYKNKNIFLDISGLLVGEPAEIDRVMGEELLMGRFKQGLLFLNNYDKVLYGSDWPLTAMQPYIQFCKALVPDSAQPRVFYKNAAQLFDIYEPERGQP